MRAMSFTVLILTLGLPATLGLQVKKEESFGLDTSLNGLPQQLAKLFALASADKATPEMVETGIDEFFEKQRALPKDKQLKLAQTIKDMFPADAVDMDEYIDWKHSPEGQMVLQEPGKPEHHSLLQTSVDESAPVPTLQRKDWNPYKDDWKEAGMHKPEMRGPWPDGPYSHEPKMEKNLRLTEENIAKDNCLPDSWLSCYTKDITYTPCMVFNLCMGVGASMQTNPVGLVLQNLKFPMAGTYNNFERFNFYAKSAMEIPKVGFNMMRAGVKLGMQLPAVCHTANAAAAMLVPQQMQPYTRLVDDYLAGGDMLKDRMPCSAAFGGNLKLYKTAKTIGDIETERILNPPKHATGNRVKKEDKQLAELKEELGKEIGEEIKSFKNDPVGTMERHKFFKVGVGPTGVWAGDREDMLPDRPGRYYQGRKGHESMHGGYNKYGLAGGKVGSKPTGVNNYMTVGTKPRGKADTYEKDVKLKDAFGNYYLNKR